jgi:hypothetical protein
MNASTDAAKSAHMLLKSRHRRPVPSRDQWAFGWPWVMSKFGPGARTFRRLVLHSTQSSLASCSAFRTVGKWLVS